MAGSNDINRNESKVRVMGLKSKTDWPFNKFVVFNSDYVEDLFGLLIQWELGRVE
ncbi:hypothetical protein HS088_TW06G01156 [Tripterygium wilfordii]|uniref:Uncharacterized protein n=1 Tax=Tripterygium wilfordii TaxID=458696 RepID=A0A7J7DL30_TRIWF|nr:hypothetical protein HS088_TW06G01156 [Tripterygium wilfordii]